MKNFKFLNKNSIESQYMLTVKRCLQEAVRWNIEYRDIVEPFFEGDRHMSVRVYNMIMYEDKVEVLFEVFPPDNPHSLNSTNHILTIPLDEYLDMMSRVESYRERYRRTL